MTDFDGDKGVQLLEYAKAPKIFSASPNTPSRGTVGLIRNDKETNLRRGALCQNRELGGRAQRISDLDRRPLQRENS